MRSMVVRRSNLRKRTTVSGTTSTVTSETGGLPVEITYAAIAVAVISIIIAVVLVMRKR